MAIDVLTTVRGTLQGDGVSDTVHLPKIPKKVEAHVYLHELKGTNATVKVIIQSSKDGQNFNDLIELTAKHREWVVAEFTPTGDYVRCSLKLSGTGVETNYQISLI